MYELDIDPVEKVTLWQRIIFNADKKNTADDSWANWENDAWESLSKKD